MESVYIIIVEWNIKGDNGFEIVAVTDKESIEETFNKVVANEKETSYLNKYFNAWGELDKSLFDDDTLDDYTDENLNFSFGINGYECYTIISVIKKEIIKK
jgi:hypothetical protein